MADKTRSQEPTVSELESGLQINEDALEQACAHQPELFHRVSKQLALLISKRDAVKQDISEIEAKVALEIRGNVPEGERVTDKAVEAEVTIDKRVTKAKRDFLELQAKVGMLSALKEAYQQRSYALNHLVELYVTSYYGESVGNVSAMREGRASHARATMNDQRRQQRKG